MALRKRTLSSQQIQEEYLLVEAAKQNPRSFGKLYERYHHQIYLFVYKRVDDEEITADLTSQVFLKAMMNLKKYTYKGVPFSAWLYRIAINEVNQFFREHKHKRTISMEGKDLVLMMEEVEEDRTEENLRNLIQVMNHLTPDEVQFIELRYFERMPFKEIAEVYRITENNAKVKMYRLLGKMKKLMEQQKGDKVSRPAPKPGTKTSPR
ncbi:MAG: sigma-70 family RNA polymerase sigma factor [Bacteroidota bacterium]